MELFYSESSKKSGRGTSGTGHREPTSSLPANFATVGGPEVKGGPASMTNELSGNSRLFKIAVDQNNVGLVLYCQSSSEKAQL